MPGIGGVTPDEGGASGATGTGGGVAIAGVQHTAAVLTTASGSIDATAGGTELFATPHMDRRRVTITNTDATATDYLYVLLCTSAGTPTISATVYTQRIAGGNVDPVSFDIGPGVRVFIFGVVTGTTYLASEEAMSVA